MDDNQYNPTPRQGMEMDAKDALPRGVQAAANRLDSQQHAGYAFSLVQQMHKALDEILAWQENVQLQSAAVSAATLSNTRSSLQLLESQLPPALRTPMLRDVLRAVKREIFLREQRDQLAEAIYDAGLDTRGTAPSVFGRVSTLLSTMPDSEGDKTGASMKDIVVWRKQDRLKRDIERHRDAIRQRQETMDSMIVLKDGHGGAYGGAHGGAECGTSAGKCPCD